MNYVSRYREYRLIRMSELYDQFPACYEGRVGTLYSIIKQNEYLCKDVNGLICEYLDLTEIGIMQYIKLYLPKFFYPLDQHIFEKLTPDICEELIIKNAENIEQIPAYLKSSHLCNLAIKQDPTMIRYVPRELQTINMHKMCIEINPIAIRHIQGSYINKELCEFAINKSYEVMRYIPTHIELDRELYIKILTKYPEYLQFIDFQDDEMCMMCVLKNALLLQYVKKQSNEMCWTALQNCISVSVVDVYLHIHDDLKTQGMCIYVLNNIKFKERYKINEFIQRTPHNIQNNEICYRSVKLWDEAIVNIRPSILADELKLRPDLYNPIVYKNPKLIRAIQCQPEELCIEAVRKDPSVLKHIVFQTVTICKEAIAIKFRAIRHVKVQNYDLCSFAINIDARAINYIRNDIRTYDLALEMYYINPLYLKRFSKRIRRIIKNTIDRKW